MQINLLQALSQHKEKRYFLGVKDRGFSTSSLYASRAKVPNSKVVARIDRLSFCYVRSLAPMVIRCRSMNRAISDLHNPRIQMMEIRYRSSKVSWWYFIMVSLFLEDKRDFEYPS